MLSRTSIKLRWTAILAALALCAVGSPSECYAEGTSKRPQGPGQKKATPRKKKKKTVDAGVQVFSIKSETPQTAIDEDVDARLNVRLVWGTQMETPDTSIFPAIEPELASKLEKVFPWKSYYKILDKDFDAPRDKNVTETLSPKARLRVRAVGKSQFRIRLYGEGNRVVNRTLTIAANDIVALAGYDEHKLGWFIVLKRSRIEGR